MLWTNAAHVTAQMIPFHALRRLADKKVVRADFLLAVPKRAVSASLCEDATCPNPAFAATINFGEKPLLDSEIVRANDASGVRRPMRQPSLQVHQAVRVAMSFSLAALYGAFARRTIKRRYDGSRTTLGAKSTLRLPALKRRAAVLTGEFC
jgi:hypothetical protein